MELYPILSANAVVPNGGSARLELLPVDGSSFGVRTLQFTSRDLNLDLVTVSVRVNARTIIVEDVPASLFNKLAQQDLLGDVLIHAGNDMAITATQATGADGTLYAIAGGAHVPEARLQVPYLAAATKTIASGTTNARIDLERLKQHALHLHRFHILADTDVADIVVSLVIGSETVIKEVPVPALEALFETRRLDLMAVINDGNSAYLSVANQGAGAAKVQVLAEMYVLR